MLAYQKRKKPWLRQAPCLFAGCIVRMHASDDLHLLCGEFGSVLHCSCELTVGKRGMRGSEVKGRRNGGGGMQGGTRRGQGDEMTKGVDDKWPKGKNKKKVDSNKKRGEELSAVAPQESQLGRCVRAVYVLSPALDWEKKRKKMQQSHLFTPRQQSCFDSPIVLSHLRDPIIITSHHPRQISSGCRVVCAVYPRL